MPACESPCPCMYQIRSFVLEDVFCIRLSWGNFLHWNPVLVHSNPFPRLVPASHGSHPLPPLFACSHTPAYSSNIQKKVLWDTGCPDSSFSLSLGNKVPHLLHASSYPYLESPDAPQGSSDWVSHWAVRLTAENRLLFRHHQKCAVIHSNLLNANICDIFIFAVFWGSSSQVTVMNW